MGGKRLLLLPMVRRSARGLTGHIFLVLASLHRPSPMHLSIPLYTPPPPLPFLSRYLCDILSDTAWFSSPHRVEFPSLSSTTLSRASPACV
ncbi:hypothetical protein RRG08_006835 [Elysia crispata]|uniref:Uncharacterized protein n=1 Tax=Elysia crispata TaxID=231223 RepID=A0AAE0XW47_9GAST|nr:hypothetical protein RRG08_006835 [Elysia crispata]